MNYRQDHLRLLKVFARELPKRPCMKVINLAKAAFSDIQKRKPDCASLSPDRACRNALRKPRANKHIEIAERGEYRLTQLGAAFCKTLDKYEVASDRKDGEPRTKKSKKSKKAAKRVSKKILAKKPNKASVEKAAAKKAAAEKVVDKKETKSVETVLKTKKTNGKKPILPPSRKSSKPTAEEQADAAAKNVEAKGAKDFAEVGGDPEPVEDLADQLGL